MSKTVGFIGGGNMAGAIMGGMIQNGFDPANIWVSDANTGALDGLKSRLNVNTTGDNKQVAANSDVLFLAVKPHIYPIVIQEIKDCVKQDVIIVVIAAGQSIDFVKQSFGREIKVVRTMPNTPALVNEGMTAACPDTTLNDQDIELVMGILRSFGKAEIVPESMMDAVTAVSGSSPAYSFLYIEALADGAVAAGMPRAMAYTFAAQAVLGAAKMVLETGMHPGALKDMVCSPGGTTIEAVAALEREGFRSAVITAMKDCVAKQQKMSK